MKGGFCLVLQAISQFKIQKFWPFNPVDKKTQAHVITPDGKDLMVAKGAPQVVSATPTASFAETARQHINQFSHRKFP